MNLFTKIKKKIKYIDNPKELQAESYEYCTFCDANLTLQKGYRNDLTYWTCKGCGKLLINPEADIENNIVWICDKCGAMMNLQDGFGENDGEWFCTECGYANRIDAGELYGSEDEFQAELRNPYRGLSDEDILALSVYRDAGYIDGRPDVILVKHRETGKTYIKKLLTTYNRSVYEYLKDNPVQHMPQIYELYESDNCLIVMEEYIKGRTVADILEKNSLSEEVAVKIALAVCKILDTLHNLPTPIIHRDIKPSNIIVTPEDEVWLLDMNVAKWYDPEKADDTRYMGTRFYAAPEQVGFGLSASSAKTDIYAVGVLLNVMLTLKFPKEERAEGNVWHIIEKCISLNAEERYNASELIDALARVKGEKNAEETDGRIK